MVVAHDLLFDRMHVSSDRTGLSTNRSRWIINQPLQEAQCRLVKRLCLASLSMAGWLLGMTIIGFLVAVVGPIGAAAVDFYSDRDLDCEDSVRRQTLVAWPTKCARFFHPTQRCAPRS